MAKTHCGAATTAAPARAGGAMQGVDDVLLPLESRLRAALSEGGCGGASLLHGPPGCGKTRLVALAAARLEVKVIELCADVARPQPGAAEMKIHSQLEMARAAAPCVLVMDELHALAPANASAGTVEHRIVLQLAAGVQSLRGARVYVIGICRSPESVHLALRRSGRLGHEVAMRAPSPAQRLAILQSIATGLVDGGAGDGAGSSMLQRVAEESHGLCGAQLVGVCQQALIAAWVRVSGGVEGAERLEPPAAGSEPRALPTADEWGEAVANARRSALGALQLNAAPTATGGAAAAAASLAELPGGDALLASVVTPLREPRAYERLGVAPPRGVLLHGPPGCGKTTLARAVAAVARANFVEVQSPQLVSSVVGESEGRLASLFASARAAAPCVLFLDQIETLAPPRGDDSSSEGTMDRLLSLLLVELDGVQRESGPPVLLLASCASPAQLDPAILRPGRLDVHVRVPHPAEPQRLRLLRRMLGATPLDAAVSLPELAARTEGFSLAQLSAVCREAAMAALRADLYGATVGPKHVDAALAVARWHK